MLTSLLESLTSLRDFLSRSFFISALVPTCIFIGFNLAILYCWSWPVHDWINQTYKDAESIDRFLAYSGSLVIVWVFSYVVASLTPVWIRTLEGRNWPDWIRKQGIKRHSELCLSLNNKIDAAVSIYAKIELDSGPWREAIAKAFKEKESSNLPATFPKAPMRNRSGLWKWFLTSEPSLEKMISTLKKKKGKYETLSYDKEIKKLIDQFISDISHTSSQNELDHLKRQSESITLLIDYANTRARSEHKRLLDERNICYSDQGDIAPTSFGNIGFLAQAFAQRAYNCNLYRIWGSLRQAATASEKTLKNLEDAKSQLDFLVCNFWLTLVMSVFWSLFFAYRGYLLPGMSFAVAGPLVCWLFWYGGAVEQYRLLQEIIIEIVNSFRFKVLEELHLQAPMDIKEERDLWGYIDDSIGNGEPHPLRYLHKPPT